MLKSKNPTKNKHLLHICAYICKILISLKKSSIGFSLVMFIFTCSSYNQIAFPIGFTKYY